MTTVTDPPQKVWASLITNLHYLPGLLTLAHSLHQTNTAYPFLALYTTSLPEEGIAALRARGIPSRLVPTITPAGTCTHEHDPRFAEAWKKLIVFSLEDYARIVLLDSDMLVRQNMDELMELPLDGETQILAASHACACNPLKKPHYPSDCSPYPSYQFDRSNHPIPIPATLTRNVGRTPQNCAYTAQRPFPDTAQTTGPDATAGVAMLNSGLLVVQPRQTDFVAVQTALRDTNRVKGYALADQELLSNVFRGRWRPLPYVYNALKPMRGVEGTHADLWRDGAVKNVHFIFAVKPWQMDREREEGDELVRWWWAVDDERRRGERARGVVDGY
ncbi:glycosyl transferase family protein [Aspergillus uvarum CBS 121591]|uniref:Glycosyl transferase family protein n=1 Tax=Aspergillus uvarum CBS 121591 TaxID=1448315 RepID=A0A319E1X1_9EURO|nr:glycosyl transferase family protein [Aspergillus uvarum CBS 121591]PYH85102.1 glycosyl transferase family protein [Aspergillus uvarum CBS 121591]